MIIFVVVINLSIVSKETRKLKKKLIEMDADPRNTASLERELHLKKVCIVMLRRKVDI